MSAAPSSSAFSGIMAARYAGGSTTIGAAGGGLSLFGGLAIGFGVAGAILGGIGAYRTNKALRRWAEANYARINKTITNARVNAIREIASLSRAAQGEVSSLLNVAPEGLSVVETLMSRVVLGVASDNWAIHEGLRRFEESAEYEKQATRASAKSSMQIPALGALTMGLQTAANFTQVAGAVSEATQAQYAQGAQQELGAQQRELGGLDVDAARLRLRSEELRNQWIQGQAESLLKQMDNSSIADVYRTIPLGAFYRRGVM